MFGRPRCREWTPLATQQLRLRSLIQIVGYNIRPPEWCSSQCSFYLTLHHTTMSAPFYTSERISSPHPKWKEIDSEITQRMSFTNVVIRIWSHIISPNENSQDTVIQTWGIYLSGLRYIGANLASNFNSDCFKCNTLVFQMHGGYFCSYKSLKLDIIPAENEEQGSLSSDSSGRTNLSKINLESKMILSHKLVKESRSVSPSKYSRKLDREYSKSQSPVERGFHQNFPTLRTSASMNITRKNDDDPSSIYEHSPENLDVNSEICDNLSKNASQEDISSKIDLSETAENYDLRNEAYRVPKYRYLALNFLKSEIRPSYNASKLQKLHLLQYSIKKRQEAVQEIKERIYKNSAVSDNWMQINEQFDANLKAKSKSQRNLFSPDEEGLSKEKSSSQCDLRNGRFKEEKPVSNGPRLALKLNDLLSFKAKPSPYQRAEHVRLTKQLEILRFKRIILSDERDSKLANIRRLKERHAKLAEENQDVVYSTIYQEASQQVITGNLSGTELMQNYHTLSRSNDSMKETRQACGALRELAARSHAALASRRADALNQLFNIFYVQQVNPITWSIMGVPLAVCGDEAVRAGGVAEAVAAGFAAQAACLAASVLNQPLRYKITLLGSATKILDITPDLPDPNIPLYTRGGDVTLFRYAMFLLNKCIGQLLAGRGLPVADIRPTLLNLERLLTSNTNLSDTSKLYGAHDWFSEGQCPRTQSLRSLVATDRGKYRQFNRFKDAVDGNSPQSALIKRHRHSRSVGSYQDEHELATLDASTTSIMGSESNIYNMKLSIDSEAKLKTSSDSDISKMAEESEVMFTLGDDTNLANIQSKLVRISTNNQDEMSCSSCLNENVKQICTEITDFCGKEIHEGFDVARYLERRESEIEEADQCLNCESKRDGDCELDCGKRVTDVIVIRSAEAILDTGQDQDGVDV